MGQVARTAAEPQLYSQWASHLAIAWRFNWGSWLWPPGSGVFVDDLQIQQELARILPIGTLTMFLFGPLMMIAGYFQAIGDAARAAILGLSRTYVFGIPLTLALPVVIGEPGIWYAGAVAEGLVLVLTVTVLIRLRLAPLR